MWQCMAQYCGKSASAIDERMIRPQNETDLLDALYHVGPIRYIAISHVSHWRHICSKYLMNYTI